ESDLLSDPHWRHRMVISLPETYGAAQPSHQGSSPLRQPLIVLYRAPALESAIAPEPVRPSTNCEGSLVLTGSAGPLESLQAIGQATPDREDYNELWGRPSVPA